ncbi:hypothetical protein KSP39_PZI013535 [Platanthera zijinensis]|uniref:Uncharacterized protein n=1 Tax=Platanthera zijinensis TaxID=2320716 RepID=A0AAP0BE40_9ASPA
MKTAAAMGSEHLLAEFTHHITLLGCGCPLHGHGVSAPQYSPKAERSHSHGSRRCSCPILDRATLGLTMGFFDMFYLAFIEPLFRPSYHKDDFILGKMTLFSGR